ncbi:Bardet-Biedl syndrome 7 protein homolog isoform X1 [Bombus pascuorum]|uniref:Bardet-Biedl syndrome 7 protein homolog isoform X1 n=1 Tax=Bombus pascuorum TaxID=65598 RepID=UPI00298E4C38|nr:Bardet-Biedl syndrome 7 protein homolog isoform X1 [Bombus pascuorum]XP_060829658.1 Bardet-Biedl syndrome 7 protein homolog isoform X1 [Bombus pascuorum]
MTLPLSRTDYAAVGVTSKGTTKVFPATEHRQTQKFAVADHDGVLHVYGIKKGELQVSFKSLPGPRINKLVLGGTGHDKIYIAQGNTVKGYTKKGKLFLEFDTNLIDPISALYVLGPNLAACARDLYHRYHDCKDADSYLAGETLYDIVLLPTDGNFMFAILACGDCAIRVLHGTKTPAILRLPSVPTVLSLYREGDLESKERVLVGTIDGKVGLLILHGNKTLRITWLLNMTGSEVTSLDTYELQDGLDILIGRQDGTVEVYTFPEEDTLPSLRYRYNAKESISSVVGGIIGAAGYPEVLVTTYSGRIFGLTTKPPGLLEADQNDGLTKLKAEIEQLQEKLKEEKEAASFSVDPLAPLILSLNHRMILNREDASYSLSIELDTPIDNILIQSDTPIELLDVESNSAVISLSTCNPREGNFVLATYRCQVNTNHLEMRLRTIEGQPGTLQIYVTSQVQPKCCRKISIPISALSLHVRQHEADNSETHVEGPFNELKLIGGFTVAEMHAWLSFALSDVPERPHLEEGEATLTYISSFIGTLLKCKYKKGSAIFLGENISSIIILRDILTREATKRKIKLDVFCGILYIHHNMNYYFLFKISSLTPYFCTDVSDGSISRVLELIFPQLNAAHDLITKVKILNALEEWELKENPKENLCSEYQKLIQKESEIKSQMAKDNDILERLHAVITDLYVDWERAKRSRRIGSKDVAEKLSAALKSRELVQVLQAFIDTSNTVPPSSSYKD